MSGNGQAVFCDSQAGCKHDLTADIEDDRPITGADGIAKAAGAGIIQVGDMIDGSAAAAFGKPAEALGRGEGGRVRGKLPDRTGHIAQRTDAVDPPVIRGIRRNGRSQETRVGRGIQIRRRVGRTKVNIITFRLEHAFPGELDTIEKISHP